MSALDDIRTALKALPPPPNGSDRFVVLGISARRSIEADLLLNEDGLEIEAAVGLFVRETIDFDGWDILECDAAGRFKSVAA